MSSPPHKRPKIGDPNGIHFSFSNVQETMPTGMTPQNLMQTPMFKHFENTPNYLVFDIPQGQSFLEGNGLQTPQYIGEAPGSTIGKLSTPLIIQSPPVAEANQSGQNTNTSSSRHNKEFDYHKLKTNASKSTDREFLAIDPDHYSVVSPNTFSVVNKHISLIEGFNKPVTQKVPGGKTNTKETIPRQVVSLNTKDFKDDVDVERLGVKCEVLGFDKKANEMVVLSNVGTKKFIKTTDQRWIAVFDNCIIKFSSHLHGQKLALRFTLQQNGKDLTFVDSKTFQTITQRGREKQQKRKRGRPDDITLENQSPWTVSELKTLLDGSLRHGTDFEKILAEGNFLPERTPEVLKLKYQQLLQ